ncbi:hypothetical protein FRC18_007098 [Serendipita sp. 400]|nr:hypothetical protein FRC18_007098 [Serendipita sp. 400]
MGGGVGRPFKSFEPNENYYSSLLIGRLSFSFVFVPVSEPGKRAILFHLDRSYTPPESAETLPSFSLRLFYQLSQHSFFISFHEIGRRTTLLTFVSSHR